MGCLSITIKVRTKCLLALGGEGCHVSRPKWGIPHALLPCTRSMRHIHSFHHCHHIKSMRPSSSPGSLLPSLPLPPPSLPSLEIPPSFPSSLPPLIPPSLELPPSLPPSIPSSLYLPPSRPFISDGVSACAFHKTRHVYGVDGAVLSIDS